MAADWLILWMFWLLNDLMLYSYLNHVARCLISNIDLSVSLDTTLEYSDDMGVDDITQEKIDLLPRVVKHLTAGDSLDAYLSIYIYMWHSVDYRFRGNTLYIIIPMYLRALVRCDVVRCQGILV